MRKLILVVGHGSRINQANSDFETFVERFRDYVPESQVRFGYIELAEPLLEQALEDAAEKADEVIVLPLFLFAAGHVKQDIPSAVQEAREKFPHVDFLIAPPLGVHPYMIRLVLKRLSESTVGFGQAHSETLVVVVGRGSSDPDANGNFYKLTRILEETSPYACVVPCFVAITRPWLPEALERVARGNPKAILIQPYLLFPGKLVHQIENEAREFSKQYPDISVRISLTLGRDPLIFELLKERIRQAEVCEISLSPDRYDYRALFTEVEGGR